MTTIEQVALPLVLTAAGIAAWFLAGRLDEEQELRENPKNLTEAIFALEYAIRSLQLAVDNFEAFATAEAKSGNRSDRFFLHTVAGTIQPLVSRLVEDNGIKYVTRSAEFPHRIWADLEAEIAAEAARNPRS